MAMGGLVLLSACAPRPTWESDNPGDRIAQARRAAEGTRPTHRQRDVYELIVSLDSSDPAERFVAFQTLRVLIDDEHWDDRGYRHHDPPRRRGEAVRRWVEALERGEIVVDGGVVAPPHRGGGRAGEEAPGAEGHLVRREQAP